jgi:hypothetical protein
MTEQKAASAQDANAKFEPAGSAIPSAGRPDVTGRAEGESPSQDDASLREQIFHVCFEHASPNMTEDAAEAQSDRIADALMTLLACRTPAACACLRPGGDPLGNCEECSPAEGSDQTTITLGMMIEDNRKLQAELAQARALVEKLSVRELAEGDEYRRGYHVGARTSDVRLQVEIERLTALVDATKWRPIETVPKEQSAFPIQICGGGFRGTSIAWWTGEVQDATHWAPMLPALSPSSTVSEAK